MLHFKGEALSEISFPLGGIGSGSVGLAGNGQLIDWEIFNRPNRGSQNGYTHFAVKASRGEQVVDARILEGDVYKGLMGDESSQSAHSRGYGHGVNRTTLQGITHFREVEFDGRFPIAELTYREEAFPGNIRLTAWNPLIPSDDRNSSIPAAFFEWEIENTSKEELTYTVAFSCGNPEEEGAVNVMESEENGLTAIRMQGQKGALRIATDCRDVSYQEYWYRGGWFDSLTTYWREFSTQPRLANRRYSEAGVQDMCTLEDHVCLAPGQKGQIRFILSWYYPESVKYWDEEKPSWRNYYAGVFDNDAQVSAYGFQNYERLYTLTKRFRDALYATTMPEKALEAAAANLAVLKSSTCMRLTDGTFYAFEGVNAKSGSCEGSCTHVWNYAYALPFLFPKLERSMRDADYLYNAEPSGEMQFRLMLPLGAPRWGFRACVDGQYGGIIKLYRDWKLSGDDAFLRRNWPAARKALEYAWSPDNRDRWDPEQSGVIRGRQHHTLDMELFGVNPWLTGFYIAGLTAGARIAEHLGELTNAERYREIAERGKQYVDTHLWNGRYYVQEIDLKDPSVLAPYEDPSVYDSYWNAEKQEIKYQIQNGCNIDQLTAQWHADLCGLGDIFDRDKARTAMKNLYAINFKSMREVFNPCRIFALNDEEGLLICNWDNSVYKPQIPIPYSEEVMTGFEYAAAAEMIRLGLEEEGLRCVEAVRDRYDGKKRNPYAEIECGASYARSMASYSLLLIYSGFTYDMPEKAIGFAPLAQQKEYKTFWSLEGAWGLFEMTEEQCLLVILYGALELRKFHVPGIVETVRKNGVSVRFKTEPEGVRFVESVHLTEGDRLEFEMK